MNTENKFNALPVGTTIHCTSATNRSFRPQSYIRIEDRVIPARNLRFPQWAFLGEDGRRGVIMTSAQLATDAQTYQWTATVA